MAIIVPGPCERPIAAVGVADSSPEYSRGGGAIGLSEPVPGDSRRISTVRVSRLSITPVKGLALHHPPEVHLTRHGAAGDRRFFLIGEDRKPVSITLAGPLACFTADYDPADDVLSVRSADGGEWTGPVVRSELIQADFLGHRDVPCQLVEGPWAAVLSDAVGRELRLVAAVEQAGGFDIRPVTLLGAASVSELARRTGLESVDSRRFRMLIELETAEPHVEDSWNGRRAQIGAAEIVVRGPVPRCAAITRDPDSGARDLPLVKAIKAYRGMVDCEIGLGVPFGVYADVVRKGSVRLGDALRFAPD